jgi:hypothetical protein
MWFYISFADTSGFLGGCYVQGEDMPNAIIAAHEAGIRPGGESLGFGPFEDELIDKNVPEKDRERLLSREEIGDGVQITTQGDQITEGWR